MGIFQKRENFDISCRDRTIKDLIDKCYGERPDSEATYQDRVAFYIEQGIKYRDMLNQLISDGYAKHKSDPSCDIPDYKAFLSLERTMLENRDEYKDKTICIEGYVSHVFLPWYPEKWGRDTAGIWIYPLPCKTETEKKINYAIADDLCATSSVTLVSDQPLTVEEGMHIRVHGVPYFYKPHDGGNPANVHILIRDYEVLD